MATSVKANFDIDVVTCPVTLVGRFGAGGDASIARESALG